MRLISASLIIAMAGALSGCPGNLRVKVYYLDPDQGLIRKQDHEVIPFPHAKGYFCLSPNDFEAAMQACVGKPLSRAQMDDILARI